MVPPGARKGRYVGAMHFTWMMVRTGVLVSGMTAEAVLFRLPWMMRPWLLTFQRVACLDMLRDPLPVSFLARSIMGDRLE